MNIIGLDLHKCESRSSIKAEDGTMTERRIVASRERFTAVLGARSRFPFAPSGKWSGEIQWSRLREAREWVALAPAAVAICIRGDSDAVLVRRGTFVKRLAQRVGFAATYSRADERARWRNDGRHFGVEPGADANDRIRGHAWVTLDGELLEAPEPVLAGRVRELYVYPPNA